MRAIRTVDLEGLVVTVKEKMLSYIGGRDDAAFIRSEFAELGNAQQVSSCLAELASDGLLVSVGTDIYAKCEAGFPVGDMVSVALCALEKLGYTGLKPGKWLMANAQGYSTQVPMRSVVNVWPYDIEQQISFGQHQVYYESVSDAEYSTWIKGFPAALGKAEMVKND